MRIAIAGTHRIGKTTLIDAFARVHPDFDVEPEPYEQLLESGEEILDHYEPDAFIRQLDHLVARLGHRPASADVIFDRSPLDFLAYLAASDRLGWQSIGPEVVQQAISGLHHVDLIGWLPLAPRRRTATRPSFRHRVDDRLAELIRADPLDVLSGANADVVELTGSTPRRLARLTAALDQRRRSAATLSSARKAGR